MKKPYYRRLHRSLSRPNRRFHSLLVRIIRRLDPRHGSDRVWRLERIRLGRRKGWDHKVVTPQFTFAWAWTDDAIAASMCKAREEYEKAVAPAAASGRLPPLPEAERAEPGQMIRGTGGGGNLGRPRLSNDRVMSLLKEGFFRKFSDSPARWRSELPYFPSNSTFLSEEDLALKMEVNGA